MKTSNSLSQATVRLLAPLVRLLLRHGVAYGTFADLAKQVYVDVATKEFGLPERKQTHSRISILTGLSRKEVLRVTRLPRLDEPTAVSDYNRAARVLVGWAHDPRYADKTGSPKPLSIDGDGATFTELVRRHSGDVPARALLDELLRLGKVERTEKGEVRLTADAFVPASCDDEKIGILGTDVPFLIGTIDHNMAASPGDRFFQRKTMFDNLTEEAVERLRPEIAALAASFIKQTEKRLAENDRDISPVVSGTGRRRAGLGIFWFEDDGEPAAPAGSDEAR